MSMARQGLFFALLGALCWGMAPIFAKLGLTKVPPLIGISVRTFIIAFVIIGVLAVSGSMKELAQLDAKSLLFLAVEGLLGGLIGHFFYFKAVKLWEASKATPIVATYPLIAFVLAVLFLGEKLTLAKGAGAILIVAGILLLGL